MNTINESVHTGEFVVSEGNNGISREAVSIVKGRDLIAGTILGKVTSSGAYAPLNLKASDGSEVAAGVLYSAVKSDSESSVIIARLAEVSESLLVYPAAITSEKKAAVAEQLRSHDIILRA